MAKIGSYDYPDTQFGTLLKAVETLVLKFPNGECQNEKNFADAIGHKNAKSGGYLRKIADLRKYKLIEKSGLKATDNAKLIIKPLHKEEKDSTTNEVIMNIGLWRELYSKNEKDVPSTEDFKIQLAEITGDRDRSLENGEIIRNLYIDAIKYYNVNATSKDKFKGFKKDEIGKEEQEEEKVPETLIRLSSGETNLTLPKTTGNITILISALNEMKTELGTSKLKEKGQNKENSIENNK